MFLCHEYKIRLDKNAVQMHRSGQDYGGLFPPPPEPNPRAKAAREADGSPRPDDTVNRYRALGGMPHQANGMFAAERSHGTTEKTDD